MTQRMRHLTLSKLLEHAGKHTMTSAEREEQKIDFATGNFGFENPDVTKKVVERAAEALRESDVVKRMTNE